MGSLGHCAYAEGGDHSPQSPAALPQRSFYELLDSEPSPLVGLFPALRRCPSLSPVSRVVSGVELVPPVNPAYFGKSKGTSQFTVVY